MLHLNAYNYDAPDSDGKYPSVTYKGDWSEQSIKDFINNFIYQDRKKYEIQLNSCAFENKKDGTVNPDQAYPEDAKILTLWKKIIKDYEPQPNIDLDIFSICCMSPSNFEKEDPYVRQKPSYALKITAYNKRLPSIVAWKTRINKEYDGKYDEQSIRLFIDEIISQGGTGASKVLPF